MSELDEKALEAARSAVLEVQDRRHISAIPRVAIQAYLSALSTNVPELVERLRELSKWADDPIDADGFDDAAATIEALSAGDEWLTKAHILFEVHRHHDGSGWLWETDSGFYQQGLSEWEEPAELMAVMLESYAVDLERLVSGHEEDGYVTGRIPVRFGRHPEDYPWEADFSRAYIEPLPAPPKDKADD